MFASVVSQDWAETFLAKLGLSVAFGSICGSSLDVWFHVVLQCWIDSHSSGHDLGELVDIRSGHADSSATLES